MESVIYQHETSTGAIFSDLNASALGLGGMTYGVTVREITSAYQIFANDGVYTGNRTVLKILDNDGKVIVDNSGKPSQIMSAPNSDIMTLMLEEVVNKGTASRVTLNDQIDLAGKTGTTSDDFDRWFIGYSPYYLGGVWFGYAMPMSLNGFSETMSPALEVWENVMRLVHEDRVFNDENGNPTEYQKEFEYSDEIVEARICKESGARATEYCTDYIERGYFVAGSVPSESCTVHLPEEDEEEDEEKDEEDKEEDKDEEKDEDKDEDKDEEGSSSDNDGDSSETGDVTPEPAPEPDNGENQSSDTTPESNDPNVE